MSSEFFLYWLLVSYHMWCLLQKRFVQDHKPMLQCFIFNRCSFYRKKKNLTESDTIYNQWIAHAKNIKSKLWISKVMDREKGLHKCEICNMFLPSGFLLLVFMWTSSASSRTRFMYSSKPCERIHWFKCHLNRNGGIRLLCFSLCFNNKCGIYHHFDSETRLYYSVRSIKKILCHRVQYEKYTHIKKDFLFSPGKVMDTAL